MNSIYFVYIYFTPDKLTPFYVGYGKGTRHLDHLNEARNKNKNKKQNYLKLNIIREILKEGKLPYIKIIDSNLTKELATELEEFLISEIGRRDLNTGSLSNMTRGGDGNRGWSESQKQEARERNERMGLAPPNMKGATYSKSPDRCYIPAILKSTDEKVQVTVNDPRWLTKELVGINHGISFNEEWLKKNSEGVAKLKWWNNGQKCVRSEEPPDDTYVRGRGKVKW